MTEVNIADVEESFRAVICGEKTLQSVLGLAQEDLEIFAAKATDLFFAGHLDGAWQIFEGLAAVAPGWYGGFAGMGAIALDQGNLQQAEFFLSRSSALTNNDPAVYANLGEVLLRQAKYEEAAVALEKALDLDPDNTNPSTGRARALLSGLAPAKEWK